jgi:hypothetical protein
VKEHATEGADRAQAEILRLWNNQVLSNLEDIRTIIARDLQLNPTPPRPHQRGRSAPTIREYRSPRAGEC